MNNTNSITDMWREGTQALMDYVGVEEAVFSHIIWTALIVSFYITVRMAAAAISRRFVTDTHRRYFISKAASYIAGAIAIILITKVWFGGGKGLVTYFGILSAGLVIVLQDAIQNMIGWLFLVIRHPFHVGDRIEIEDITGDVVDMRLFAFSLIEVGKWVDADQSTGRIVHVPNGWIFKKSLFNFTQGFNFIWDELPVTITFESNWKKAKAILREIADKNTSFDRQQAEKQVKDTAQMYLVVYKHLTPIVWTKVVDIGVTLTIRHICEPRKRRLMETSIWESILEAFAKEPDIDFAYPTQRYYFNPKEGKAETGGPPGGDAPKETDKIRD